MEDKLNVPDMNVGDMISRQAAIQEDRKMDELKPCPFCGGEAHLWTWNGGTRIDCKNWKNSQSETHIIGIGAKTREEAIRLWNRRERKNDE